MKDKPDVPSSTPPLILDNPEGRPRVNPGWVAIMMASEHAKSAVAVFRKMEEKGINRLPPRIQEALDSLKNAEAILTESAHGRKEE